MNLTLTHKSPKERVIEALQGALICGIPHVEYAQDNYLRYYDLFFAIEDQELLKKEINGFTKAMSVHYGKTVDQALIDEGLDPKEILDEFEADLSAANKRAEAVCGHPEDNCCCFNTL